MPHHHHDHDHPALGGHVHAHRHVPAIAASGSLLRASAVTRLAFAAGLVAAVWAGVLWVVA